jgi:hypothetical protein
MGDTVGGRDPREGAEGATVGLGVVVEMEEVLAEVGVGPWDRELEDVQSSQGLSGSAELVGKEDVCGKAGDARLVEEMDVCGHPGSVELGGDDRLVGKLAVRLDEVGDVSGQLVSTELDVEGRALDQVGPAGLAEMEDCSVSLGSDKAGDTEDVVEGEELETFQSSHELISSELIEEADCVGEVGSEAEQEVGNVVGD